VDLLNIRFIITRSQDLSRMAAYPWYRHIASLPGNELLENKNVFPRFFLVHQVRTVGSLKEARDVMSHRAFDLRKTAIVEQAMEIGAGGGADEVKTLRYEPNAIELLATSGRGGLLVLSETYYPGWRAWVDDQPATIYQTDIALRGVIVPGGAHRVRMEFRPLVLPVSFGISLGTAILLAISAFVYRRNASQIQLK
jgi:hypothetical protein